jgi:glutaconate CoA-transferase subunit A
MIEVPDVRRRRDGDCDLRPSFSRFTEFLKTDSIARFWQSLKISDDLVPIEQLIIDSDFVPEVAFGSGNRGKSQTRQHKADENKSLGTTHVSQNTTFARLDLPKYAWHNQTLAILPLNEAIRQFVHDGDIVALEGFTHLIPFAAGHEIIRQGRRNLTLIRMTPDLIYDQLIGSGCASKLIFSWGGNPGVGSLHRFRDAVENQWPAPLAIEEHDHAGMAAAYAAGAANLPFGLLRGYLGTDLPKYNSRIKFIECPFTGERLAAVPAIRPDVSVIHAQKADQRGNILLWGVVGVQKEAVLAGCRSIVTVEEIVDRLDAPPNAVVLPYWVVGAVSEVKGGAFPSYAQGYYSRNNAFYKQWDRISREREGFQAWMQRHVLDTQDFEDFRRSLDRVASHA